MDLNRSRTDNDTSSLKRGGHTVTQVMIYLKKKKIDFIISLQTCQDLLQPVAKILTEAFP